MLQNEAEPEKVLNFFEFLRFWSNSFREPSLLRADEKHISRRLTTGAGSLGLDHGEVISK
jgi:hypothetical protein